LKGALAAMGIRRWSVVFLGLCALQTAALDPSKAVTQYLHSTWTSTDGLPQNSGLSVLETRDGYLWVGTQEGLARFDGLEFKVFDRSNVPVMTNLTVQALAEDPSGALWVGTEGGGVLCYEKGRWSAHRVSSGLPSDIVHDLCVDRTGVLWAGTYGGVGRLKEGRWTTYRLGPAPHGYRVRCLLEDDGGTLWAGTEGGGIYRFVGEGFQPYSPSESLPDRRIRCLGQSPEGDLWVGMENGGLAAWRGGRWELFTEKNGLPGDRVFCLLWDRDGCLWVGTEGGGLGRYARGSWSRFTTRDGLGTNLINALHEDSQGSIWIGVFGGGLERLREGKWTPYSVSEGLSSNTVWCAFADPENGLWAGTEEGLCRFDGVRWTSWSTADGLPHNRVRSILKDRRGVVWVGTGGGGLARFEGGRWFHVTPPGLPANERVYALLEDRDGVLWVGTYGSGVHYFDGKSWGRFSTSDGLGGDRVRCLLQDRSGAMWFGTYGGGVSRLFEGRWTTWTTRDGLPSDLALTLFEDSRGCVWLGTSGGGLALWKNGKWHGFTAASGLCDEKAFQFLEDRFGRLWISSNKGVSEVELKEMHDYADGKAPYVRCRLHTKSDGLLSQECNGGSQPAGCRTLDGRIWFPTPGGLVVLDPERIPRSDTPPRVVLSEVLVNKEPVDLQGPPRRPLGRGEVEIRYAGLSLEAPEKVSFRYRLEPYESEWVEAGRRRQAFYTNLPPGEYRFRLMASSEEGVWSEPVEAVFALDPPFWKTGLFKVLTAGGVLALGAGLFFFLLLNARRRAATLERVVAERTSELADANQRLEELSVRDCLTGAYNRRRLEEFLDQEWKRGIRTGRPLSVLLVDVDRFKSYNDEQGHAAGDAVLTSIVGVLEGLCRRPTDLVARYGGDEFVVVLAEMDVQAARDLAETLRANVEKTCRSSASQNLPGDVTVSVGGAGRVPAPDVSYETLLREADAALHLAKQTGRNTVRWHAT